MGVLQLERYLPAALRPAQPLDIDPNVALQADGLSVAYGSSVVLRDVSVAARQGEVLCIMGRNGAGKTTLLKSLVGVLVPRRGRIALNGHDVTRYPAYKRVRRGMGYVPQGRGIFPHLTVFENLLMGLESGNAESRTERIDYVYGLFPVLDTMAKRTAGVLSGGQQQQLAIGRALMGNPTLLLLDEPTEGIQPSIVQQIEEVIRQLRGQMTVVLVEQFLDFALNSADYCCVMERGEITLEGPPSDLDAERLQAALAV